MNELTPEQRQRELETVLSTTSALYGIAKLLEPEQQAIIERGATLLSLYYGELCGLRSRRDGRDWESAGIAP